MGVTLGRMQLSRQAGYGQELPITGSPGGLEELANNIPDASRVLFAVTLRAPL